MDKNFIGIQTMIVAENESSELQSGAYLLWYTVLSQALEKISRLLKKEINSTREKRELRELTEWFFSNEEDWIGSFLSICFTCNISSGRIRDRIRYGLFKKLEEKENA